MAGFSRAIVLCCLAGIVVTANADTSATAASVDFDKSCDIASGITASPSLLWYRTAAERKALYQQAFTAAFVQLRVSLQLKESDNWVVVADADETLLDNSPFQCELERRKHDGKVEFDPALWNAWVTSGHAQATPGAAKFVRDVHALGGKIIVITNRSQSVAAATMENFKALGLLVDGFLFARDDKDTNKNRRFIELGENGMASVTRPHPDIKLYLGDNIEDFPGIHQNTNDIGAEFGQRFIVMPNPMYGSWQKNSIH